LTRDDLLDVDRRIVAATAAAEPGHALYVLARELVATGVTQLDLYAAFLAHTVRDDDDAIYDSLADPLDCIHGGGWSSAAFFDKAPSDEEVKAASERHARGSAC